MIPSNTEEIEIFRNDRVNSSIGKFIAESFSPKGICVNLQDIDTKMSCDKLYNCCDCGGNNCGCRYCFSCNACEICLGEENT